jgi:hypothetical protein
MGDMNFPDPNTTTEHDGWEWDSEKWTKWGSGGSGGDNTTSRAAIASGVMATGEMVVVNADGTVSVVAGGVIAGEVVEAGYSDSTMLNTQGAWSTGCYDPSSGKVVIAHKNNKGAPTYDNSTVLTLGTVSEDSVVFSTPYEWQPSSSPDPFPSVVQLVFDPSSNSVVILYAEEKVWDKQNHKTYARVLKVSGDKVSQSDLGPKCLLDDKGLGQIKGTFDPNSNQIIIAYCKWSTGSSTRLHITTGKVSGDEITFGTAALVSATTVAHTQSHTDEHFDVAFDPIADRAVVAWRDYNTPKYGKCRVCKVNGSAIMDLGTETVWESSQVENWILQCQYESKSGKIIIHYWGNYGANLVAGTVQQDTSGNAIQFGSYVQYLRVSVRGMMACDPYTGTIQIAYSDMTDKSNLLITATVEGDVITFGDPVDMPEDSGLSQIQCIEAGDALCLKTSYDNQQYKSRAISIAHTKPDFIETNLTADNYIGVCKGDYADGAEATVQVAGINSNQQGMTVGKQYIQPDGSLDTTEGTPSVLAGTAISSTELNIKDLA